MTKLSTAAWAAHNLGLGASLGGLLFGKVALNPSLSVIDSKPERGKMLNAAWNRYNAVNVVSLGTAAATRFVGRAKLPGSEIGEETRNPLSAKNVLFGAAN